MNERPITRRRVIQTGAIVPLAASAACVGVPDAQSDSRGKADLENIVNWMPLGTVTGSRAYDWSARNIRKLLQNDEIIGEEEVEHTKNYALANGPIINVNSENVQSSLDIESETRILSGTFNTEAIREEIINSNYDFSERKYEEYKIFTGSAGLTFGLNNSHIIIHDGESSEVLTHLIDVKRGEKERYVEKHEHCRQLSSHLGYGDIMSVWIDDEPWGNFDEVESHEIGQIAWSQELSVEGDAIPTREVYVFDNENEVPRVTEVENQIPNWDSGYNYILSQANEVDVSKSGRSLIVEATFDHDRVFHTED